MDGDRSRSGDRGESTVRPLRFPSEQTDQQRDRDRASSGRDQQPRPDRGGPPTQSRVRQVDAPDGGRSGGGGRDAGTLGFGSRQDDRREAGGGSGGPRDGRGRDGGRRDSGGPGTRVRVVEVREFDDCEDIGRAYRSGHPVIFDLGNVDTSVGRRVLDFVSGMTFGLHGSLDRAGNKAFLLVPDGVVVPEDEHRRLAELGFRSRA